MKDFLVKWRDIFLYSMTFAMLLALLAACGSDDATTASQNENSDVLTPGKDTQRPDNETPASTDDENTGENPQQDEQESMLPELPWNIREPGHYRVGYKPVEIIYQTRVESEQRTIRLAIWYPTLDTEGIDARYFDLIVRRGIFHGASAAHKETMPVLVFSHGHSGFAEQSHFLTEYFASHGWIVVAPDHVGNTMADTPERDDLSTAGVRPQDVSAALDALYELPQSHPVHGLASQTDIVISGHSFGGYTTLAVAGTTFIVEEIQETCSQDPESTPFCHMNTPEQAELFKEGFLDPRARAAIVMTPVGFEVFQDGLQNVAIPALVITSREDKILPREQEGDPIWQSMRGSEHLRVDFVRGGHFTFANLCEMFGTVEVFRDDGCSEAFIPPQEAHRLTNIYAMAFIQYHLFAKDDYANILDGTEVLSDEIELSFKN